MLRFRKALLVAIRPDDWREHVGRDFHGTAGALKRIRGFPRSIHPCENDREIVSRQRIVRAVRQQLAQRGDALLRASFPCRRHCLFARVSSWRMRRHEQ